MSDDLKSAFEIEFERELELKLSTLNPEAAGIAGQRNDVKAPEQLAAGISEVAQQDFTTSGARADSTYIEERRQTCLERAKVRDYVQSLANKSKLERKEFETKGLTALEKNEKTNGKIDCDISEGSTQIRNVRGSNFKDKIILLLALIVGILVLSRVNLRTPTKPEKAALPKQEVTAHSVPVNQVKEMVEQKNETSVSPASQPEVTAPAAGRDREKVFKAFVSHGVPQAK